jgi:chromosome segregation ATPase
MMMALAAIGCDQMAMDEAWLSDQVDVLAGTPAPAATPTPVAQTGPASQAAPQATYLEDLTVREEGDDAYRRDAVDAAIEWSDKYAELAENLVAAERENHVLQQNNQQLQGDLANLRAELQRTQKELEDANTMLVDLHQELDGWKKNVLGFRDEMRAAQKAQLDALRKVLTVLGGELPSESTLASGQVSPTE